MVRRKYGLWMMWCAHLDAEVIVEPRDLECDEVLGEEALGEDVGFDLLTLRGLAGKCGANVPTVDRHTEISYA